MSQPRPQSQPRLQNTWLMMEAVKKLKDDCGTPPLEVQQSDSDISSTEGGSENQESESEASNNSEMEFQMEFEARSIDEDDYHGIRRLIQQLFQESNIDLSGLTELAITQSGSYGSTIKLGTEDENGADTEFESEETGSEEENHVYGVTTFIPITQNKDLSCIQQLLEHLLAQCKLHCDTKVEQLSELLQDLKRPAGLLINERFLNLPVQLGSLVLQSLVKELKEVMPSGSPGSCELVVVIARSRMVASTALAVGHKRKDRDAPLAQEKQLVFDYFENEFLMKDCLFSFSYPVWKKTIGSDQVMDSGTDIPFRTVLIMPFLKFEEATNALHNVVIN